MIGGLIAGITGRCKKFGVISDIIGAVAAKSVLTRMNHNTRIDRNPDIVRSNYCDEWEEWML